MPKFRVYLIKQVEFIYEVDGADSEDDAVHQVHYEGKGVLVNDRSHCLVDCYAEEVKSDTGDTQEGSQRQVCLRHAD